MPTYEYECKSCGHVFEAFQNMSDAPLRSCPQCGKDVRRLINGGTGIIFKGSGFYVTDNGKGKGSQKSTSSEAKKDSCTSCAAASGGGCAAEAV
ncbi:MAG: FmdB family transcriptional regulator [Treponemataceae bacterium]|uniref:FmdB family zinc ribbon protein n=1 Tax=Treponema sp. J25 TaxID=2094121 RepID=UPI001053B5EB|nr:FmdB family zinc ribbon protein [Treponema sp. J25]MCX7949171.1 FmdB family transcriptional regulator [Treponemataceae bacterium]TCW62530.1 FmdB family transcriptional regulator [Treponema sp. J25]